jgi:mycothiol synthase
MNLNPSPYAGPADQTAMAALVHAHPTDNLHVVDLPYRLCSWGFDAPENVGLWRGADGTLQAWAALQTPFWTIDFACQPAAEAALLGPLLAWADQRARFGVDTPHGRQAWFVNVFDHQADRIRALEAAGFASQADVGENSWTKVLLRRVGAAPMAAPVPAGFTLRSLAGQAEVEAYVAAHRAAFESTNMTAGWRARTLQHAGYRPDLDLVAEAPDGRLAAFCVGWLHTSPDGTVGGQIEPMGAHPDFQRLGLGRALLTENLRRMAAAGAGQVFVETDSYRDAAFELYEAMGFAVAKRVLVFRKDYA